MNTLNGFQEQSTLEPLKTGGSSSILQTGKKVKMRINGDKLLLLNSDEILCFIAHGKHADIIHADGNKERIFHSLADLEKCALLSTFIRAGRSYFINSKYIYRIDMRKQSCTLRFNLTTFVLENLSERGIKVLVRHDGFSN